MSDIFADGSVVSGVAHADTSRSAAKGSATRVARLVLTQSRTKSPRLRIAFTTKPGLLVSKMATINAAAAESWWAR